MRHRLLAAVVLLAGIGLATSGPLYAAPLSPIEQNCSISNFGGSNSCRINIGDNPGGNVTVSGLANSDFGALLSATNPAWIELGELGANPGSNSAFSVTSSNGSLMWSLASGFFFNASASYAFAIKSASPNAVAPDAFNVVYLMNNNVSSGMFNTSDLAQGFSNIRLFGTQRLTEVPPTSPIPLPAAGWMLLAGIGGLAAWGRRRKAV